MKFVIADDHARFRAGLTLILEQHFPNSQIFQAANTTEAQNLVNQHQDAAIVLLDLNLPDTNGMTLLNQLQDLYPTLPIAILSAEEESGTIKGCLEKGALGFIPKSSTNEILVSAIKLMLNGGAYIPDKIFAKTRTTTNDASPPQSQLTQRQLEIIQLLAAGMSNKQICNTLHLALGTIKAHISAILMTMNATNRTQAVDKARKSGLIQ